MAEQRGEPEPPLTRDLKSNTSGGGTVTAVVRRAKKNMDTFFYLTSAAIAILGVVTLVGCLLTLPETRRIRARLRDLTARAESLLENTGGFVEHQELLLFRRGSPWGKQRELETLAAQREAEGWLYWKITAANPLRTIGSWGGGVTVHFVRPSVRQGTS